MRRTLALVIALTVSIGAACGDDSDTGGPGTTDDPEEPREPAGSSDQGWETIEESSTEPLTLGEPTWGSESDGAASFVRSAAFHDDAVVLLGGDEEMTPHRLEVVDPAAGELRWSLDEFDDEELPGSDGARLWLPSESRNRPPIVIEEVEGDDWAVMVSYSRTTESREDEYGVAALSGETGEVLWMKPVVAASDEPSDDVVYDLVGGDGVVVALTHLESSTETFDFVALDAADGEVLWEGTGLAARGRQQGLSSLTVSSEAILAQVPNGNEPGQSDAEDQIPEETVVAWDPSTGETLWELDDRYPRSQVVAGAGDVALVQVPAEPVDEGSGEVAGPAEMIVLETSTGDELTSFGTLASLCVTDQEAMIACLHGGLDPRYATFGVEDQSTGLSQQSDAALPLVGAHDGYLFASDTDGVNQILDRSGTVLDDSPPGRFIAMSDQYAIFTAGDVASMSGSFPYTIHPVS